MASAVNLQLAYKVMAGEYLVYRKMLRSASSGVALANASSKVSKRSK
jgi:hypothetical protein